MLEPFSIPEEFELALLVYGLGAQDLKEFNAFLKIPKAEAVILHDTLQLKNELVVLADRNLTNGGIFQMLYRYHQSAILVNLLAANSYYAKKRLELYLEKLRHVHTFLNGKDLLEMGITAGPQVKETLEILLEAKLDGRVKTREEEIAMVKKAG